MMSLIKTKEEKIAGRIARAGENSQDGKLEKPFIHNGKPRRSFSSWQIPKSIRENYGIRDGIEANIALRFGRKSVPGPFHITSGGELYLPTRIASKVEIYAQNNPDASLFFEMEVDPDAIGDIKRIEPKLKNLKETMRHAIVAARIGQGEFRTKLMHKYGRKCAVTGIAVPNLLRASHIKPWRESSNEERLSADNGLLLVANLDAAFDAKLISFSDKGKILFHEQLGPNPHLVLGIRRGSRLAHPTSNIQQQYLAHHRKAAGLHQ